MNSSRPSMLPGDCRTLPAVLRAHSVLRSHADAFRFLDSQGHERNRLDYAGLDRRASEIGRQLQAMGLRGERVLLLFPAGLDFIAALLGCFYAGVTAVPVPLPVTTQERALARAVSLARDAEPAGILSISTLATRAAEAFGLPQSCVIATDSLQPITSSNDFLDPDPQSLAMLQYTSGTTGKPRGVMLTHENLMANQRILHETLRMSADDRAVCWLPHYHDMGLIGAILQTIYAGCSCALMSPLAFLQRPRRWLEAISRTKATISMAPNFAYALCARRADAQEPGLDLSSWRLAICGGEPVIPETLGAFAERFAAAGFRRAALMPCYGMAESTLLVTADRLEQEFHVHEYAQPERSPLKDQTPRRKHVGCGSSPRDHRLAIVDPLRRVRLSDGQEGEIWLQGPSVAQGYWRRSTETSETFHARIADEAGAGDWLRTGDLGFLTPDGLCVTGRCKDLIILRGVNIDPLEIELSARGSHPSLEHGAGAAFGTNTGDTEAVVLVHEVGRTAARTLDSTAVAQAIAHALHGDFGIVLHDLVLVAPGTLPRTTSGKIQRRLCKELYGAGQLSPLAPMEHLTLGRSRRQPVPSC